LHLIKGTYVLLVWWNTLFIYFFNGISSNFIMISCTPLDA
jgi:hypothetical protein